MKTSLYPNFTPRSNLIIYNQTYIALIVKLYRTPLRQLYTIPHPKPYPYLKSKLTNISIILDFFLYLYTLTNLNSFIVHKLEYNTAVNATLIKFNFRSGMLFVSIMSAKAVVLLNLRPGLYRALLPNLKKNFKRTKAAKILLIRHLRKLLLAAQLSTFSLVVAGVPLHIKTLLNVLSSPLILQFLNPYTGKRITDFTTTATNLFTIPYIYFIRTHSYTTYKTKRVRRLKRKITRRLFHRNSVKV